jgi:cathepsin F
MNKTSITLLVTILSFMAFAQEINDEKVLYEKFEEFIARFGKTYPTIEEYQQRFQIFGQNLKDLENVKKQSLTDLDDVYDPVAEDSMENDISSFFDLTDEEYERMYMTTVVPEEDLQLSANPSENSFITGNETEADKLRHLEAIPSSYDWRSKGVVSPVRAQGLCGACYAFSAASNIESQYAIKTGRLLDLSEQQIVNCNPYAVGCHGGNVGLAIKYVTTAGLGLETSDRYVARKEMCSRVAPVVRVQSVKYAGTKDENYIAAMLVKYGPLATAINARMFKYYSRGIMKYSTYQCSPYALNHAVNIVGYGVSGGVKYWIIRNTWGPRWGENGYLRVAWGTCGVNSFVVTAILE